MVHIWSYLLVALCAAVTSAGVIDYPGNRNGFHGNLVSGVKDEKVLTPPSDDGLIIDSNGFPGNSNEVGAENDEAMDCEEACSKNQGGDSCLCDLPPFIGDVLNSLFNENDPSNKFKVIPFNKEDIIKLENSELCKTMCADGVRKPPCKCDD